MRSHGEGSLSAATLVHLVRYLFDRVDLVELLLSNRVKVLSPEITLVAMGQWFHILEINVRTWENRSVPTGIFQEAGEVTRKYDVSVVGPVCVRKRTGRLTHNRGVSRVMPIESQISGHSKWWSALICKGVIQHRPI